MRRAKERRWPIPPRIAGSAKPAWFANVPYHGTSRRSSRRSVVPIRATQPAAVGPPRLSTTTSGAIDVFTIEPRGISTGRADARNVTAVQKMSPAITSACRLSKTWRRIASPTGITRLVTTSATAHAATSPVMKVFRLLFMPLDWSQRPELTLARTARRPAWDEGTQKPLSDAPPASNTETNAATTAATRRSRDFMNRYPDPWRLEALETVNRDHCVPSKWSPCPSEHGNRPDWGRSVALVAPPRPKCPFQARSQRVRD